MTTVILFILTILALVAVVFGRRQWAIFLLSVSLICFVGMGSGVFVRNSLNALQTRPALVNTEWKPRNVIVVLGLGTTRWPDSNVVTSPTLAYPRIYEAARQYHACKRRMVICRILTSGGDPLGNGVSEADTMANELEAIGIPSEDLIIEPNSRNTFLNARYSAMLINEQKFDQVILVTSGMHLQRAMIYFSHFIQKPIVGAPADRMAALGWLLPLSPNFLFYDAAVHELAGLIQFWVRRLAD